MIFERTPAWDKDWRALNPPAQIRPRVIVALGRLDSNHPDLRLDMVDVERGIWAARVDDHFSFTFQWIPGGVRLRRVGTHRKARAAP